MTFPTTSFDAINPRTNARIRSYRGASSDDVDRAAREATSAAATFRSRSADELAALLDAIATELEALGNELLQAADEETALGIPRLTNERARTCFQLRSYGAAAKSGAWLGASIDTANPDRKPLPKPDVRKMLRPIGPVVVFGASNFPFAYGTLGGDTASALAAGNPVIVKGHPAHPQTSALQAQAARRAIDRCGFPAGTFALLQGTTPQLSQALVEHPAVEAVGFTGSLRVGRQLFDWASARPRPIPVYAEMGSVNPVFILPHALQQRGQQLANELAASATLGAGQFCTAPGIILAARQQQEFGRMLSSAMGQSQPGTLLHGGIARGLSEGVKRLRSRADVETIMGGDPLHDRPNVFANTLLRADAELFAKDAMLREELFGPVSVLVEYEAPAQLRAAADALEGNLTATLVFDDEDLPLARELMAILETKVGRLIFNGVPTGVEVCHSMQHGGPYPASTAPATTSVGDDALLRFARPVSYQNCPQALLPEALQDANPLGIWRTINGQLTRDPV